MSEALKALQKQFENLRMLGDSPDEMERIPFGVPSLDETTGGGIVKGRIAEIFGPDGSGKTTLLYHLLAQAKGQCAFLDTEHRFDPFYAKAIGVDVENLWFDQPFSGESALQEVEGLIGAGVELICVDSVAGLVPRAELEGEIGDANVGGLPRLMSQFCRMSAGNLRDKGSTLVFTNQIRERIGLPANMNSETQPGGRALRFWASQRIDVRRIQNLTQADEVYGHKCKIKAVKNCGAPPHRQAIVELHYGKGFSAGADLLDAGLKSGEIKQSGAWFEQNGNRWQGRRAAIEGIGNV